ncbi:hypothetical protein [Halopenitus persicus]|uniref:hypothetical protein n=1 Tax=Halopenitus persicus TaxID=1048396 RepID=UPI000BBA5533|nr:hypothetical protein [Halopenitus persicus]
MTAGDEDPEPDADGTPDAHDASAIRDAPAIRDASTVHNAPAVHDAPAARAIPADAAETRRALRAIAEDVRADSSESQQVAAVLYRVSDLYDPAEDTSPEAIYRNVRQIMRVKAQGGLDR